jgi:5-methylcytosine-specific restriction protein A
MPQTKRRLTGKFLNKAWGVGAKHALYVVDGNWYHQLTDFPGAFFDGNGYIVFRTEREYGTCSYLQIVKDVNIPKGISSIPGYVRVSERNQLEPFSRKIREAIEQKRKFGAQDRPNEIPKSLETPKALDLPKKQDEVREVLAQIHRIIRDTDIARRVKYVHNYRCQICGETIKLHGGKFYAESHHIKPLGNKHNGPDVIENIICVCPNHHVQLDYGAIRIDMTKLRRINGHNISEIYVEYHNTKIYRKEMR